MTPFLALVAVYALVLALHLVVPAVVREGRAQEIATEPLELLAVAAIDGRRGVEVHAEGRHGQRRRGDGLGRGREVRAGERALHAGAERRVHVEVVVGVRGEDRRMHLREHGVPSWRPTITSAGARVGARKNRGALNWRSR